MEELVVALTADIKDLKAKLAESNKLLNGFNDGVGKTSKQGSNSFNSLTNSVKGLVGAYIGLQSAQQAVGLSFQNSLKLDALQGAFGAIFGSVEEGERQLERLRAKSEELGVEFSSLASAYKLFAGATTQSGMSISQTNKIFDSVAKASAVLKLSSEDTEGALRALAQMMGKGTVQAEELRGQLGERVPGAFKLAANAMGVTEQELGKMMEQGQVMAKDLLPKLATELDKAFGNKVTGDIQGLTAEFNRFKNIVFGSTSGFSKFFETIFKGMNRFLTSFQSTEEIMTDFLKKDLSGANTTKDINSLILKLNEQRKSLREGSMEWRVYNNAIVEAGRKIKELQTNVVTPTSKPSFKGGQGGDPLSSMAGSPEQMKVAQELFSLYQRMPNILSSLGSEYANNPFFRDLINGDLKNGVAELKGEMENLKITSNLVFTDPAMQAYIENMQNIVSLVGNALTQSFESALTSGQDFFKVLGQAIKALISKLVAAVLAAAALNALLAIFTGGASIGTSFGSFSGIFKSLSGFSTGAGNAFGDRVVSPVQSSDMGNVSFEIRGDKLYGVLQNYEQRLDRLQ